MPQLAYTVSADTVVTARRIAENIARSHGWRNVQVLSVMPISFREYRCTVLVS